MCLLNANQLQSILWLFQDCSVLPVCASNHFSLSLLTERECSTPSSVSFSPSLGLCWSPCYISPLETLYVETHSPSIAVQPPSVELYRHSLTCLQLTDTWIIFSFCKSIIYLGKRHREKEIYICGFISLTNTRNSGAGLGQTQELGT